MATQAASGIGFASLKGIFQIPREASPKKLVGKKNDKKMVGKKTSFEVPKSLPRFACFRWLENMNTNKISQMVAVKNGDEYHCRFRKKHKQKQRTF